MGMGTAPASAWTISLNNLQALCPKEVAAINSFCEELGISWDEVAMALGDPMVGPEAVDEFETPETFEFLEKLWGNLATRFNHVTQVDGAGLDLYIGYYSQEDGDLYDSLEESFYFHLGGVQQLTPAGEKFQDQVSFEMWTQFG
jgi:hypothetical protein